MKTETTTEKTLREAIASDFDREQWSIAAHDALARVIKNKWVGKKVNKRIEQQFKEEFAPDPAMQAKLVTYLEYIASMCNLKVWGFGPYKRSDECLTMFLGYADLEFRGDGNPRQTRSFNSLTVEGFEENDGCHGKHAKDRQEKRKHLLNGSGIIAQMAALIDTINDAKAKLETLGEYDAPGREAHYAAQKLIKD